MSTTSETGQESTDNEDAGYRFDVTFHLKSGQTFTVRMADLEIGKNRLTKEFQEMSWTNVEGHPRLRHVNMDQIAAILVADVEPDA